jgi:hypothetical protein
MIKFGARNINKKVLTFAEHCGNSGSNVYRFSSYLNENTTRLRQTCMFYGCVHCYVAYSIRFDVHPVQTQITAAKLTTLKILCAEPQLISPRVLLNINHTEKYFK